MSDRFGDINEVALLDSLFLPPHTRGISETILGNEGGTCAYLAELLPDTILAPPGSHDVLSLFVNNAIK